MGPSNRISKIMKCKKNNKLKLKHVLMLLIKKRMLIDALFYTFGLKAGTVVMTVHRNKEKLPPLHMKTSSYLTRTTKTFLTKILLHQKRSVPSKHLLTMHHLHQFCQQKKCIISSQNQRHMERIQKPRHGTDKRDKCLTRRKPPMLCSYAMQPNNQPEEKADQLCPHHQEIISTYIF